MAVLFHLVLGRTVVGPSPPARKLMKDACRAETIPTLVNVVCKLAQKGHVSRATNPNQSAVSPSSPAWTFLIARSIKLNLFL
jgi:hypothetical protein